MQLKEIGSTGVKISRIGFGCASIGCEYGIKINGESCILLEKETSVLVDYAINKGIKIFDTAPAYGRSEEILGKALKGKRHSVVSRFLLLGIIPLTGSNSTRDALNKAIKKAGADALIDV